MFDTHAHLCSKAFSDEEISALMQRAEKIGVKKILNIATNPDELTRAIQQQEIYPQLYIAGSTTPHEAELDDDFYPHFEKAAMEKKMVAIGETGLDYYYENSDKELQKKSLIRYLTLAKKLSLPIIIHCRDAFSDLFDILDAHYSIGTKFLPGLLHCFTGTLEEANYLVEKGWLISCSGIATFKKSVELREVFAHVPLQQLIMETDAPYLAPGRMRGKRNEPSYIIETAQMLSELKEVPLNQMVEQLTLNAERLLFAKQS